MKLVGFYDTEYISIKFIADSIMYDYDVSDSPTWYEPDPNTIEIISCHIAGTKVNVSELPMDLQESLLKLSDWVDFSKDY